MSVHEHHADVPADLRPVALALDELARAEWEAAPPALEDRLFMLTRASLVAAPPARVRIVTRLRVAAAIAVTGALAALWLGRLAAPEPGRPIAEAAQLEAEFEWLMAVRNSGEGLESLRDGLRLLELDAETISDSLGPAWPTLIDDGGTL